MKLRFAQTMIFAAALVATASFPISAHAIEPTLPFVAALQEADTQTAVPTTHVGDLQATPASYSCASGSCSDGCVTGGCHVGDTCSSCGACGDSCGCGKGRGLRCRNGRDGDCFECQPRKYDRPDLFYNYYTGGACNCANAQMYVSPVPVPQFVGHTYYTYQPFYPHELMYKHTDRYNNPYDNGRGLNRTKVKYSYPPVRTAMSNLYWNKIRLPR